MCAYTCSVSKEEPATDNHDIVADGYNIGRDELVADAIGTKSFGGITYSTTARNVAGLMAAGSQGVNHGMLAFLSRPLYLGPGLLVSYLPTER